MVTGRPGHDEEQLAQNRQRWLGEQLGQRRAPPRLVVRRGSSARTAVIRAASKNMCSVRHKPMPFRTEARCAVRAVERRLRVRAHLEAAHPVRP